MEITPCSGPLSEFPLKVPGPQNSATFHPSENWWGVGGAEFLT